MTNQNNNIDMNQVMQAIAGLNLKIEDLGNRNVNLELKNNSLELKNNSLEDENKTLKYKVVFLTQQNEILKKELRNSKNRLTILEDYLSIIEKSVPMEEIHRKAKEELGDEYLEVLQGKWFNDEREMTATDDFKGKLQKCKHSCETNGL